LILVIYNFTFVLRGACLPGWWGYHLGKTERKRTVFKGCGR